MYIMFVLYWDIYMYIILINFFGKMIIYKKKLYWDIYIVLINYFSVSYFKVFYFIIYYVSFGCFNIVSFI